MLQTLKRSWGRWQRDKGKAYREFYFNWRRFFIRYSPAWYAMSWRPARWMLIVGLQGDGRRHAYAATLQAYPVGFFLDPHTDGPQSSQSLLLELWRAREGGVFSVDGPHHRWLGGRVWTFDGGKSEHGFTKITKGRRVTLILSRAFDGGKPVY